ncbi:hypothetical protein M3Y99_01547400 [Aphelenchoides fujianensis]|nr:hypothetical protein M3Y99_01547400 [Aphelenchoides fujianensis]
MFASKLIVRSLHTSRPLLKDVQTVVIVGGGQMGSGIAQVSAQSGLNVVLVDQNDQILEKAKKGVQKSLERVAKKKYADDQAGHQKFVNGALEKIQLNSDVSAAVKRADLVIEAIVENVEAKQQLFAQVEKAAPEDAIIATNTSSLRLADISAKLQRPENFGGLHFFNPPAVMKLLEVVKGEKTSEATYKDMLAYGKKIGKTTVQVKDTPGFVVNRLLVPFMFEALRLAERGDASIEDIDTAMKLGASHPMGPFQLADYVGLDTLAFIQQGWKKNDPNNPLFADSELLNKLVREKKLGVKSGEGFFKYSK